MMDIYQILASSDWRQRKQAVEALSRMADAELAQALLEIVRKDHENLSALNAAVQILSHMGRAAPVDEVADLLNSSDEQVRMYVLQILGLFGDERAVPALLNALDDVNENVRFNSIEALGEIQAPSAAGALIRALNDGDSFTRYAAVVALGKIGAALSTPERSTERETARILASVTAVLMPLLGDAYLAEPAVVALGSMGRKEAVRSIIDWLEDSAGEPLVALSALAQIIRRHASALDALSTSSMAQAGRQNDWERLALAVEGLLAMPEEQQPHQPGIAPLEALLQDAALVFGRQYRLQPGDLLARRLLVRLLAAPAARQEAEAALSAGPLPAAPELIAALEDPNLALACSAACVLAALRDPSALHALLHALEAESPVLSAHAAEALGALASPEALNALVQRLNAPDLQVRQAVILALTQHPSAPVADQLAQLLASDDPHLREAAVRVLAETGDRRAAQAAITALEDPEPVVRKTAVEVLPRTGSQQAAERLEQVLQSADAGLRASAARALAYLPLPPAAAVDRARAVDRAGAERAAALTKWAVALLGRAVQDPDGWVRMYACRSLGKLAQPEGLPWLRTCLTDRMPPVRLAAMEALMRIDPSAARPDLLPLLNDPDQDVRTAAQRCIETAGPPGHSQGNT